MNNLPNTSFDNAVEIVHATVANNTPDIEQFYNLANNVYAKEHNTEISHSKRDLHPDRDHYILLRDRKSRKIVGGVCLSTIDKNLSDSLPFQDREEFNNWERMLPRVLMHQFTRSQISSLALDVPEHVQKMADGMKEDASAHYLEEYISGQKTRLIREAVNYAFATRRADVCITLPKCNVDNDELKDPKENAYCVEKAIDELGLRTDTGNRAVATLRDNYLISTGSEKIPQARQMYVMANNEYLARYLRMQTPMSRTAQYDSDERMFGSHSEEPLNDVNWQTRVYPQRTDSKDTPGRKGPDALIFDWDMVFNNHVPRYVAAANAAIVHIKQKYGIDPVVPNVTVKDVGTDTPQFINKLYIGNYNIKAKTIHEADGKEVIAPARIDEKPSDNPTYHAQARVMIAEEALEVMEKHLEKHKVDYATEIYRWSETLKLLREKNIPYAVVSNSSEKSIRRYIKEKMGEDGKLFDGVPIFGNSNKPDPTNIFKACGALGVKPSEHVWFVGDTMRTDIKAAMKAGVHPILFGFRDIPEIDKLRNDVDYSHDLPGTAPEDKKKWGIDCVSGHTTLQIRIAPERFREQFKSDEERKRFSDWVWEFHAGRTSEPWIPDR